MKNLVWIIVAMMVLGAVVPGCDDVVRYDGRLTAADSLIHDHADSALTMLEALAPSDLATEGDRSYHDLLLTQARYKCYRPATSDSAINRALAYYRAHPNEREKLTRAYIYKGTVMEELGHPDSAMFYYKTAEAETDTSDFKMLGYINLRIADLYQSVFVNDCAVVERMKKATLFFTVTGDSSYLVTTIGTQGLYDEIVGADSARLYLEKAITIGKKIKAPSRFFYQSKLAGKYFYDHNFGYAKDLSLDIILNGKDFCDENLFYYYAARSYVRLNQIDSALYIKSVIPTPQGTVDSMNMQLLLAELSQASQEYRDYADHIKEAHLIDNHVMKKSAKSLLSSIESDFDANHRESELKENSWFIIILIVTAFLLFITGLSFIAYLLIRKKISRYKEWLNVAQKKLEELITETDERISLLESERNNHRQQLSRQSKEMDYLVELMADSDKHVSTLESERKEYSQQLERQSKELERLRQRNKELESEQQGITDLVSSVVRHRNLALRELYDGIRVKSDIKKTKTMIPLVGMIKELNSNHRIFHTPPKDSFWENLRISVDGEYKGIATFVAEKFPFLSVKELHLFLLMCGGFPNPIIRICMGYSNDTTVSNNKRRLIKEKMKLDLSFDEFLNQYLQGRI